MFRLIPLLLLAIPLRAAEGDAELLYRVKAAIADNALLKHAALTISLKDGVAVIGGAVPSEESNAALLKVVQAVPGVKAVRADCWVPAVTDPLQAALKDKLKLASEATTPKPAPVMPKLFVGTPVAGMDAAYSPVPPPAPPAPPGPKEFPTIAPPKVPVTPGQDVEAAVEAVRQSDVRFQRLSLRVNAGAIAISGPSEAMGDAWVLAAAVRKVPGVEKVIVAAAGR